MEILRAYNGDGSDPKPNYVLTPSLLDAWCRYKKNDDDETFNSLFDRINGIYTDPDEQRQKGIDFEKFIDLHIDGKKIFDQRFDADLIAEIADKLQNCTGKQIKIATFFHTPLGIIKLHGRIDYDFPEMIADLKTTENYKCNKYADNMQHPCYSLIRKLEGKPIKSFKYVVTDFKRRYQETYIINDKMHDKLMRTIASFIHFLEYFRQHITNQSIFGGE